MTLPKLLTFGAMALFVCGLTAMSGYRRGWSLGGIFTLTFIAGCIMAAIALGT